MQTTYNNVALPFLTGTGSNRNIYHLPENLKFLEIGDSCIITVKIQTFLN